MLKRGQPRRSKVESGTDELSWPAEAQRIPIEAKPAHEQGGERRAADRSGHDGPGRLVGELDVGSHEPRVRAGKLSSNRQPEEPTRKIAGVTAERHEQRFATDQVETPHGVSAAACRPGAVAQIGASTGQRAQRLPGYLVANGTPQDFLMR